MHSDEIVALWKAGEIDNLGSFFNDDPRFESTFVKWADLNVGYKVPQFFCGDRQLFDDHYRTLIEQSQSWGLDLPIV